MPCLKSCSVPGARAGGPEQDGDRGQDGGLAPVLGEEVLQPGLNAALLRTRDGKFIFLSTAG